MDWKEEYKKAEARMTAFLNKHNGFTISEDGEMFKELSQIFHHEEEIEDEKIRKHLISLFEKFVILGVANECETSEIKVDDILSWLEKKELKKIEQKLAEWHREDEQNLNACLGYIPDEFLRRWLNDVIHAKYDKPTDKVEPKFKVGEWIYHEISGNAFHINRIENHIYISDEGATISFGRQNDWRLWTIQDAKDGDVLCTKNKCCPFIYDKGRYNNGLAYYYVGIDVSGNLNIKSPHNMLAHFGRLDNIHLATKEQRDLLFKKMHEAGYEWDAEKKELKKIEQTPVIEMKTPEESLGIDSDTYNKIVDECVYGEQNPAWSEEDESMFRKAIITIDNVRMGTDSQEYYQGICDWLKSLKERVQPQPQQEWSKEEVEIIDWLVASFDSLKIPTDTFYLSKVRPFLISLKNKIQPIINEWSEEDEKNFARVDYACLKLYGGDSYSSDWLRKFLGIHKKWKPSDEQVMVLAKASETYCDIDKGVLYSLYNDLKKLREG